MKILVVKCGLQHLVVIGAQTWTQHMRAERADHGGEAKQDSGELTEASRLNVHEIAAPNESGAAACVARPESVAVLCAAYESAAALAAACRCPCPEADRLE